MRNRNGSGGSVERQESESEGGHLLRRALVRSSLRRLLVRRFCSAPWSATRGEVNVTSPHGIEQGSVRKEQLSRSGVEGQATAAR